jgi:membrane protease subunit HflC
MNISRATIIGGAIVIALIVLLMSLFTVQQTQQALVVRLGQPQRFINTVGLHVKMPFLDRVVYFDRRVLNLDLPEEEVIAQDRKRLVVDAFARWRITDPLRFYQALTNTDTARLRLQPILASNVRRILGAETFAAVLSGQRAELMHDIRDAMNVEVRNFGINITDVRIKRADLPAANSDAIYRRMQQERVREANEFRAQGDQISQEIRSKADRDVTVLEAEATKQSEILRGEGDGERNRIFADAFNRDAEFFAFYRSMRAYTESMKGSNTTIVLSPDSEFFRYFEQGPTGR